MTFSKKMVFSTDDVSVENLQYFKYWDYVKQEIPTLRLIAFVIAEGLDERFDKWYEKHKDWVEIGVHCYSHDRPQEGWRTDQEDRIHLAYCALKSYLPKRPLYRPPGFRFLPRTEGVLKEIGFAGIAHREFIKYFDAGERVPVFNTHCTFKEYENPIGQIWKKIAISRLSL